MSFFPYDAIDTCCAIFSAAPKIARAAGDSGSASTIGRRVSPPDRTGSR